MAKRSLAMAIFTLEEAARFSGRSAREVRLLLERGEIPGRRRAGRWTVTSQDLERTLRRPTLDDPDSHRPVGADPGPAFGEVEQPGRGRTADRDARLLDRVRRLEHELAEVRGELVTTETRVVELELQLAAHGEPPAGTRDRTAEPDPEKGMRQALTPLFRPENTRPRGGGRKRTPPQTSPGA